MLKCQVKCKGHIRATQCIRSQVKSVFIHCSLYTLITKSVNLCKKEVIEKKARADCTGKAKIRRHNFCQ